MIQEMHGGMLEEIMEIWLSVSRFAHPFIPEDYWRENAAAVRDEYLPAARTFVDEEAGRLNGFLSVLPGGDIGALFVREEEQGKGVGGRLLAHCQSLYDRLTLRVYVENTRAVGFYRRNGFAVCKEQTDQGTGRAEYAMSWTKSE